MKKSIVLFAFAIATFAFVSCKEENKDAVTDEATTEVIDEHAGHNHEEGAMHTAGYICPMDCEKGKIYDKDGKCPVCEMDLMKADVDATLEENHDH